MAGSSLKSSRWILKSTDLRKAWFMVFAIMLRVRDSETSRSSHLCSAWLVINVGGETLHLFTGHLVLPHMIKNGCHDARAENNYSIMLSEP